MSVITELAIVVLAGFVGYAVISKVPNTLHTPLMSGTNAIHGIVVLGGLLLMHEARGVLEHGLLVIAIAFGTINVLGGFFVTDRMLGMFKAKPELRKSPAADSIEESAGAATSAGADSATSAGGNSGGESAGADSGGGAQG
jgi:H+-translocating NAD(P) transhydrogenase subunit alpha